MNGFIHNYARPEQKRKREIFYKLARSQACINMDTRTNKHVLIYTTREKKKGKIVSAIIDYGNVFS